MKLELTNNICTFIFLAEMIIKLFGLGLRTYFKDSMNLFDGSIVIVSIIELILLSLNNQTEPTSSDQNQQKDQGASLTYIRGFRLLRVFRLARNWPSFHEMVVKLGNTLKDLFNFFIVLLIIVTVFSLLGVELFNGQAKFDDNNMVVTSNDSSGKSPVRNFDDFQNSFVSIFECFLGDWAPIMHKYARAK